MNRNILLYLQDILRASQLVQSFAEDMTFEQFMKDEKTSSAVIRQLEILGEATKNIPDDIRLRYGYIPWRSMAGMRDRLIHSYFGVDYRLVWDSVQKNIPDLIREIPKIIDQEKK